jgi:type II secretory pathway component GspD/PulD (secretin)
MNSEGSGAREHKSKLGDINVVRRQSFSHGFSGMTAAAVFFLTGLWACDSTIASGEVLLQIAAVQQDSASIADSVPANEENPAPDAEVADGEAKEELLQEKVVGDEASTEAAEAPVEETAPGGEMPKEPEVQPSDASTAPEARPEPPATTTGAEAGNPEISQEPDPDMKELAPPDPEDQDKSATLESTEKPAEEASQAPAESAEPAPAESAEPAPAEPAAPAPAEPAAPVPAEPAAPALGEPAEATEGVAEAAPMIEPEGVAREPSDEVPAEGGIADLDDSAAEAEPQSADPAVPKRLKFNFRFQPWEDVLDWFAQQAELSLIADNVPPGTFNYTDDREYTPAEAIDLINSVLLTKGYTLVRRERMLILINLDDDIPPDLVTTISLEELDKRGEFELVRVLFELESISPEDAQTEIQDLVGRQGKIVVLPKSNQILVTETAGKLRTIRRVIQRMEDPTGIASARLQTFPLKYVTADEAMVVLRSLLDIPPEENATDDGSLRLAVDAFATTIFATGKSEMLTRVGEILQTIDVAGPYDEEIGGVDQALQLEVYPVYGADPDTVLSVMQTLLAGLPQVRLDKDEKTGNLIALARPNDHATIRATLDQLQMEAPNVEVIQLHSLDPEVALVAIKKLFGASGEGSNAPEVDADPMTRQLLVRGTPSQIEQIKALLEKMGETGGDGLATRRGNVRTFPFNERAAESALEKLEQFWPTIRDNKIRVVTPSAVIPSLRPGSIRDSKDAMQGPLELKSPTPRDIRPSSQETRQPPVRDKSTSQDRPARFMFASEAKETPPEAASASPSNDAPDTDSSKEPPPIVIAIGPGGVTIASDDLDALDQFEELLTGLINATDTGTSDLTIFYLKYSRADVVAQTLDQVFGGGTLASGSGGGGSMLGDMANAALGDTAGGVVSSLLGLRGSGGTITPSGSILITPDERLNALIVQATPVDLGKIELILEVLDQKESPEEILANPKPRTIPIRNMQAEEVAEIVRQVYQNRMVTSGQQGQRGGGGPSPEQIMEFMRRMRGGQGGGRSSQRSEDADKMAIAVDARTNSLIVAASDALFREVEEFVKMLDEGAVITNQTVRVVPLRRASPELIEQALGSLAGDSVQVNRTQGSTQRPGSTSGRPTTSTQPGQSSPQYSPQQIDAFRQRMQMFRGMRGGQRGGTPSGGTTGRPGGR